jgi:hypothetical protein
MAAGLGGPRGAPAAAGASDGGDAGGGLGEIAGVRWMGRVDLSLRRDRPRGTYASMGTALAVVLRNTRLGWGAPLPRTGVH